MQAVGIYSVTHGRIAQQRNNANMHGSKQSKKYASVPVVHHEELEVLGVVHDELKEAVGQNISGGLVRAYT
jgi:hypothetical protein